MPQSGELQGGSRHRSFYHRATSVRDAVGLMGLYAAATWSNRPHWSRMSP